jgi:hypothetical protein
VEVVALHMAAEAADSTVAAEEAVAVAHPTVAAEVVVHLTVAAVVVVHLTVAVAITNSNIL